jgi:S-methylmethionine-dependent homocysteine/selenocysteine methylase
MSLAKYRQDLPQLKSRLPFLTEGAIETILLFHQNIRVPYFASFPLLSDPETAQVIRSVYEGYVRVAVQQKRDILLETSTWRATQDWARKIGNTDEQLAQGIRNSVQMLEGLRRQYENEDTTIVISGNVGPRGDGYNPDNTMSAEEAEEYFTFPFGIFKDTAVDMVSIMTVIRKEEVIGVINAAKKFDLPIAVSFTVETDGQLRTGEALSDVIRFVDKTTHEYALYYMINCAHPTHFMNVLEAMSKDVRTRIRGIRANSSRKSHDELDGSDELDSGDIQDLGECYANLMKMMDLYIVGGCCGTDTRHIDEIGKQTGK